MRRQLTLTYLVWLLLCGKLMSSLITTKQRIVAKGKLLCGEEPARQVKVQLIDYDTGPNPDDVMDTKTTNNRGEFVLDGVEEEFSNIDPYIYIYHDCNDSVLPCHRRWKVRIPDAYINAATSTAKVFDVGILNLEAILPSERRRCITHH